MEDYQFCKMKLFNFYTRRIMEDYQFWKLKLFDFQIQFIMENTHLKTVISPGSKFHVATLLIKRKPLNIDFAGTFVDCWRLPFDFSSVIETSFGHQCHLVFSISTEKKPKLSPITYQDMWLTCWKERYPEAKYVARAHTAFPLHHNPPDSISSGNPPISVPTKC